MRRKKLSLLENQPCFLCTRNDNKVNIDFSCSLPFFPAEYLIDIPGIQILRVYGNVIEEEDFPIPNRVQQIRKTTNYKVPEKLKRVALHMVIRDENSPFAEILKDWEDKFARMKEANEKVPEEEVKEYLMVWRLSFLGLY